MVILETEADGVRLPVKLAISLREFAADAPDFSAGVVGGMPFDGTGLVPRSASPISGTRAKIWRMLPGFISAQETKSPKRAARALRRASLRGAPSGIRQRQARWNGQSARASRMIAARPEAESVTGREV